MNDNFTLDNLLHETQVAIQDARDFSLPDDMVINAVNSASDFFGQPHPYIVHEEGTCEMANNSSTLNDDIIGFSRQQMLEMGVYGEDALNLVMTHECCHRALQDYGNLDPWEHELACDYFAGVRAAMQHMDSTHFENALANTTGGDTHPVGFLRVDFIEYGKEVAHDLQQQGVQPTFENCLEHFNNHLIEENQTINHEREAVSHHSTEIYSSQLSFTGKYSESEISRMQSDVKGLESELSNNNSDVEHHRRCVDTVDTPKGHENGNYDYEVNQLNKAISDRNYTADRLRSAKEKLNDA